MISDPIKTYRIALQVSTAAPGKKGGLLVPVQVKGLVSNKRPLSRALSFIPVTRLVDGAFYVLKTLPHEKDM